MIWESYPWKEELLRIAARLEKKAHQRRWTDRTDANLERDVFVACYSIRKLVEVSRLSEQALSLHIPVAAYPHRPGKRVTLLNWHKLDDLYDFGQETAAVLALRELCNQFIHSYVFCPVSGEGDLLEWVAVSSDRMRRACVYLVGVRSLIELFRTVGNDHPSNSHAVWDEGLGDYRVTNL